MPFRIDNVSFEYCTSAYNRAESNERIVEVALGIWFLHCFPDTIEIGAVMPHYGCFNHIVIDLCEHGKGILNIDASDYDYKGKDILCISTVEHVGRLEFGNKKEDKTKAIHLINKINREALYYLITFPLGWNRLLEEQVKKFPNLIFMKRFNDKNEWAQIEKPADWSKCEYNKPYRQGNYLCIITNIDTLLHKNT